MIGSIRLRLGVNSGATGGGLRAFIDEWSRGTMKKLEHA
jgi:hypothetical protein